jgi:hypothetical protein
MKVHQTLVWLNLLSFRTKDLTEPTIGIQSAAANHNTMLHHFDTSLPAVPAVSAILVHSGTEVVLVREGTRAGGAHHSRKRVPTISHLL